MERTDEQKDTLQQPQGEEDNMCLYPQLIKNRKYTSTKKNGGVIPAITDKRVLAIPIGCGRCMECRKKKAREWQVRLLEEIKDSRNGHFVTLTFSNKAIKELSAGINNKSGYERDNEIATKGVRLFLERWRKKYKKSVRHWLITELGHNGTENIHLHGFIWTDKTAEEIKDRWQYGYVWDSTEKKGYVNEKTINYCVKYVYKQDEKHKEYRGIILSSNGIGKGYMKRMNAQLNAYNENGTDETYKTRQGHKTSLPMYYRNKLYSDNEREKLWIEKIDKEIRYVNGIEISTKESMEEYWKVLEQERKKNKRLGYGDKRKDWDRKKYEEERRNLLHEKRVSASAERAEGSGTSQYLEISKEEITNSANVLKPNYNLEDIWDDNDYCPF